MPFDFQLRKSWSDQTALISDKKDKAKIKAKSIIEDKRSLHKNKMFNF